MGWELINCEFENDHEWRIQVETSFFGLMKTRRIFVGSGTVFHDIETGSRPGTTAEGWLSDAAWKADYGQAKADYAATLKAKDAE